MDIPETLIEDFWQNTWYYFESDLEVFSEITGINNMELLDRMLPFFDLYEYLHYEEEYIVYGEWVICLSH